MASIDQRARFLRCQHRRLALADDAAHRCGRIKRHDLAPGHQPVEDAAQEWLLRNRECCHVRRTLAAAQDRAQGDHHQFVEVVQASIAGLRILQPLKAGDKLVQHRLPRQSWLTGVDPARIGQALFRMSREFQVRFPCFGTSGQFRRSATSAIIRWMCCNPAGQFMMRLGTHPAPGLSC
jgi:hypothetical protein